MALLIFSKAFSLVDLNSVLMTVNYPEKLISGTLDSVRSMICWFPGVADALLPL